MTGRLSAAAKLNRMEWGIVPAHPSNNSEDAPQNPRRMNYVGLASTNCVRLGVDQKPETHGETCRRRSCAVYAAPTSSANNKAATSFAVTTNSDNWNQSVMTPA